LNDNATQDYYLNNSTARFSVLLTICIGSFLTPLSLSATLVAIPAIAKDLNANAIYVSWIPSIFLLSNIISLLPAGRLADIYGRKRIYLLGTIIFLFASVLASFSTNIFTLLVFRAIQGIGAAFFFSTGMAIITSVFHTNRGAALGWVVASVYFGLTCGPFLGGLLTDYFGWQSVFLFQAPLALLSILLILIKMKGEWRSAESLKLNIYGASILAICLICFFIGISSIPEPKSLLALSFAACFLVLFLRHTSNASNPIVNLKIVKKNKVFSNALLASVSMYAYPCMVVSTA